jgi:hypothetical protein
LLELLHSNQLWRSQYRATLDNISGIRTCAIEIAIIVQIDLGWAKDISNFCGDEKYLLIICEIQN